MSNEWIHVAREKSSCLRWALEVFEMHGMGGDGQVLLLPVAIGVQDALDL